MLIAAAHRRTSQRRQRPFRCFSIDVYAGMGEKERALKAVESRGNAWRRAIARRREAALKRRGVYGGAASGASAACARAAARQFRFFACFSALCPPRLPAPDKQKDAAAMFCRYRYCAIRHGFSRCPRQSFTLMPVRRGYGARAINRDAHAAAAPYACYRRETRRHSCCADDGFESAAHDFCHRAMSDTLTYFAEG